MQLDAKEDLNIPANFVMQQVTDFSFFERIILRRNVTMERKDDNNADVLGVAWDVQYLFRGKHRHMAIKITEYDPNSGYTMTFKSGGINGITRIDVLSLSAGKTRLMARVNMKSSTLTGRLLLQSFKLTKGVINKRFETRFADFANKINDSYHNRN